MRKIAFIVVALLLPLLVVSPSAGREKEGRTLKEVAKRGYLRCGVNGNLPGFGLQDESGTFSGFDVDFCRSLAAAILGDAGAVDFVPLTAVEGFPSLQAGAIDVLIRNSTRTLSREADLELDYAATTFYDGLGLMTRIDSGISTLADFVNKSICVQNDSQAEDVLSFAFADLGIYVTFVPFADQFEAALAYDSEYCDALPSDKSGLAALRTLMTAPAEHMILDETLSKEPLGPVVRHGDDNWKDIVDWAVFCAFAAEEHGVTSDNAEAMLGSGDPRILRLLGVEGALGEMLGLGNDFCYQAITQVGNYSEIYDGNLGPATELHLPRNLNLPYTEGGLLYAPPFR